MNIFARFLKAIIGNKNYFGVHKLKNVEILSANQMVSSVSDRVLRKQSSEHTPPVAMPQPRATPAPLPQPTAEEPKPPVVAQPQAAKPSAVPQTEEPTQPVVEQPQPRATPAPLPQPTAEEPKQPIVAQPQPEATPAPIPQPALDEQTPPVIAPQPRAIDQVNRYLRNPELLHELAEVDTSSKLIQNTGLTDILQQFTFGSPNHFKQNEKQLNQLLQMLVDEARKGNADALKALTLPNDPHIDQDFLKEHREYIKQGFPQNTPLDLLVKMGNLEGVKIILPALKKEDLLRTNLRGNSAFYVAMVTGQMQLAAAILRRAQEFDVADNLLNVPNKKDPQDLLPFFFDADRSFAFKPYLDVANNLFGGEEINKAIVGQRSEKERITMFRNRLLEDLNKIRKVSVQDLRHRPDLKALLLP